MKKLTNLLIITLLLLCSCRTQRSMVSHTDITEYRDSVIQLPAETVHHYVPMTDTLYLETSTATAKVHIDTIYRSIVGEIANKPHIKTKVPVRTIKDVTTITETITKYKTTKWGRFCSTWFWVSASVLVLLIGFIIWRIFKN